MQYGTEAPPELMLYRNWRDFGDPWGGGWMEWPPQFLNLLRVVGNVYRAMQGWLDAANQAEWCNKNQAAWEIVGIVLKLRRERDYQAELTPYERWLTWNRQDGKPRSQVHPRR